jgi:hypothetical protein
MSGKLYDVVAVRPGVRLPVGGPYDEIDARYHAKRLKKVDEAWRAERLKERLAETSLDFHDEIIQTYNQSSPPQTYEVVEHPECEKCIALGVGRESSHLQHTCSKWYETAPALYVER